MRGSPSTFAPTPSATVCGLLRADAMGGQIHRPPVGTDPAAHHPPRRAGEIGDQAGCTPLTKSLNRVSGTNGQM